MPLASKSDGRLIPAIQRHPGRFEAADGGTIFLDEIGELPAEMQIALLRLLQEREFERIGGTERLKVDLRVLAATNRDLQCAVSAGTFRPGPLLSIERVSNPRARAAGAGGRHSAAGRVPDRSLRPECGQDFQRDWESTCELFQPYDWPGNIRERQNVVERAVVPCDWAVFSIDETG
jgi:transcriptional regulator with GAF, ATPase, and Fis domain